MKLLAISLILVSLWSRPPLPVDPAPYAAYKEVYRAGVFRVYGSIHDSQEVMNRMHKYGYFYRKLGTTDEHVVFLCRWHLVDGLPYMEIRNFLWAPHIIAVLPGEK